MNPSNNQNIENLNTNQITTPPNIFAPIGYSNYYIYPPPVCFQPFLQFNQFGPQPFQQYPNSTNMFAQNVNYTHEAQV